MTTGFHWYSSVDNWPTSKPASWLAATHGGLWDLVWMERTTARTKYGPIEMLECFYRRRPD